MPRDKFAVDLDTDDADDTSSHDEGEGEDADDRSPTDKWPTRYRAAVILGVHVRTLDRMVASGELHPARKKGVLRFNPIELAECNSQTGDVSGEIRESLRIVNESLKVAQDHAKQLFTMVTQPSELLLKLLASENARLTQRVSELEDKHVNAIDSMIAALELQDERETRKLTELERQKRLSDVLSLMLTQAPKLFDQFTDGMQVTRFLKSLKLEDIQTLKEAGVLNEQQYQTVFKIRGEEVVVTTKQSVKDEQRTDEQGPVQSGV